MSKPVLGAGDTEEPKIDFFLSLPLWKDLGRLKNRVMGVIWEVLRVRRPDPAAVGGGHPGRLPGGGDSEQKT